MRESARVRFAEVHGGKPDAELPEHFKKMYEEFKKADYGLTSNHEPRRHDWPMIYVLAERFKAIEDRLAALEARRSDSGNKPSGESLSPPPRRRGRPPKAREPETAGV